MTRCRGTGRGSGHRILGAGGDSIGVIDKHALWSCCPPGGQGWGWGGPLGGAVGESDRRPSWGLQIRGREGCIVNRMRLDVGV